MIEWWHRRWEARNSNWNVIASCHSRLVLRISFVGTLPRCLAIATSHSLLMCRLPKHLKIVLLSLSQPSRESCTVDADVFDVFIIWRRKNQSRLRRTIQINGNRMLWNILLGLGQTALNELPNPSSSLLVEESKSELPGLVVGKAHFLQNIKCRGTAAQDSQSEANEGAYSPLPSMTCSESLHGSEPSELLLTFAIHYS
jgi:hypothetical protein